VRFFESRVALTRYKGIDISDIDIVVQYQVPGKFCTLYQRFGRTSRDRQRHGLAVLIAEPRYFDATKKERAERAEKLRKTKELQKRKLEDLEAAQAAKKSCMGLEVKKEDTEAISANGASSSLLPQPVSNTPKTQASTRQTKGLEVETVMDQFINAHSRPSVENACRHAPGNQFFVNPAIVEGACRCYIRCYLF
jgi:superfamily II DNA/RNA helicase